MVIFQKNVPALSEKSLERFVLRARRAVRLRAPINVLVTTSSAVRGLNRQFRGKNQATDVLSFPSPLPVSGRPNKSALAGEIAISANIAMQNADRLGHSPATEVNILTLHGILHLAGFDHERDNGAMAREEIKLRRKFNLPLGLIERAQPIRRNSRKKTDGEARSRSRRTS